MLDDLLRKLLCASGRVKEELQRDVARFLNRLLGMHLPMQEVLFTYFTRMMDAMIAIAKAVSCSS